MERSGSPRPIQAKEQFHLMRMRRVFNIRVAMSQHATKELG